MFGSAPAIAGPASDHSRSTLTPIKHLVVIFDENVSFDHYFGTYPNGGQHRRHALPGRREHARRSNNLVTSGTLTNNPNLYAPKRLAPAQAVTCDQNHSYAAEQQAVDGGKMDLFVQKTEHRHVHRARTARPGSAMDYYDGNTVTGLWNYAQNYAMSDNSWDTTFGPSTPGALNLISGQTHGANRVRPEDRRSAHRIHRRRVAERARRRHGDRRPRPGLRRLLGQRPHVDHRSSSGCRARTSATCSTRGT